MLNLSTLQEQFNGRLYKNPNGVQNSFCVEYPTNPKVYTYNVANLMELGYKLNILDESKNYIYSHDLENMKDQLNRLQKKLDRVNAGKFGLVVRKGRTDEEIKVEMTTELTAKIKEIKNDIETSIIL